jgi:hypothetical protein
MVADQLTIPSNGRGNDSGSQQQQIGIKTYSRDQARKGKASIDDIVSGKAVVRD